MCVYICVYVYTFANLSPLYRCTENTYTGVQGTHIQVYRSIEESMQYIEKYIEKFYRPIYYIGLQTYILYKFIGLQKKVYSIQKSIQYIVYRKVYRKVFRKVYRKVSRSIEESIQYIGLQQKTFLLQTYILYTFFYTIEENTYVFICVSYYLVENMCFLLYSRKHVFSTIERVLYFRTLYSRKHIFSAGSPCTQRVHYICVLYYRTCSLQTVSFADSCACTACSTVRRRLPSVSTYLYTQCHEPSYIYTQVYSEHTYRYIENTHIRTLRTHIQVYREHIYRYIENTYRCIENTYRCIENTYIGVQRTHIQVYREHIYRYIENT